MCGVAKTFGNATSAVFFVGSSTNTSSAAPARCPLFSASAKSPSLINSPRAALISHAPFFICASVFALIKFCVAGLTAVCSEMKLLSASNFSSGTSSTCISRAAASLIYGSYPITRMSNASARTATSLPMRPSPINPRVLPRTSVPAALPFSHLLIQPRRLSRHRQQQREGMLRHAHCVSARRAHHQHSATRGLIQINVVHADSGPPDHAKPRRLLQQFRRRLCRSSNDQRVRGRQLFADRFFRGQHHVPARLLLQQLDPALTDLVRNNDFHHSSFVLGVCCAATAAKIRRN